jgi:glutathione synthase/RimK-type ligase-like ATP-grasp enzyme
VEVDILLLILSDAFDSHADVVENKLKKEEIPYYRLNLDVENLKKTYIVFENGEWKIKFEHEEISSNQITCVWCRRSFVELSLQERSYEGVDFKIWKNEWNKTLLGLYNSLKNVAWLNPLRKAYKGENKYYQMELARQVGFVMPETIVTNDKNKVTEFVKNHKKTIFKLMSQEIYEVGDNDFEGLYTNIINEDDLKNFSSYEENPIVLQDYIEKKFEVRYTVVGDKHFVCRIDSQSSEKAKNDWRRYDITHTPHYKIEPPIDIKNKVNKLLNFLGLEYGAFDFIVTPNDEWIFLEINCMGQWLWIEQLTGMPISDAIVEWVKKYL